MEVTSLYRFHRTRFQVHVSRRAASGPPRADHAPLSPYFPILPQIPFDHHDGITTTPLPPQPFPFHHSPILFYSVLNSYHVPTKRRETKEMRRRNTLILFLFLFLSSTCLVFFVLNPHRFPSLRHLSPPHTAFSSSSTTVRHLAFGIASSSKSFPNRLPYLRLWWDPRLHLRGFVFLDSPPPPEYTNHPELRLSSDSSHLPYSFPGRSGLRSAVRVARVIKDLVFALESEKSSLSDVRWLVLGDDDTVFFPENLAAVLGKYDWRRWYYIGGSSEMVEQNEQHSFNMAFGGGGFAVSLPLARAVAGVLDSCLVRYAHLYGSDARVFSCIAELGVGLTREPGFHQVDLRGNIFGMLSAHPLTPLLSLHHLDNVEPIFPGMNQTDSLKHLFRAVHVDPGRILQQSVCYDHRTLRTVSVSWGYAVQVFEGNQLLPNLLSWQETFTPWRRRRSSYPQKYMVNTREFPKDPCKQPAIFYLENVLLDADGISSIYTRRVTGSCASSHGSIRNLKQINVFSQKLDLDKGQLQAPRRHCCDVSPLLSSEIMVINIRKCKDTESISMNL